MLMRELVGGETEHPCFPVDAQSGLIGVDVLGIVDRRPEGANQLTCLRQAGENATIADHGVDQIGLVHNGHEGSSTFLTVQPFARYAEKRELSAIAWITLGPFQLY